MKFLLALAAAAIASLFFFGQSACSPEPAITLDGGPSSGADSGAIVCTQIGYAGNPIAPVQGDGPAPDAIGGAITDGVYRLTTYTVYNTTIPTGSQDEIQGSIKFSAGSYEVTFMADGAEDNESGTYTVSGTTLTLARSCPTADPGAARRYSIAGSIFQLYDVSGSGATDPVEVGTYQLDTN